jgi:hypothetical protein
VVSAVAATGAALVLAFVLSSANPDGSFYERHFVWLFWVNLAVAGLLALVILRGGAAPGRAAASAASSAAGC